MTYTFTSTILDRAYEESGANVEMPKDVPMVIQERAYTSPIWSSG